jgi:hypothetical protein
MSGSTLTGTAVDVISGQPLPGLHATVCQGSDPNCSSALAQGQTDSAGAISIPVPPGGSYLFGLQASGYVEFTSPTVADLWHWGYPVTQPVAPLALPLLPIPSIAEIAQYNATYGLTQDPSRGEIGMYVADCSDSPAPGVELAIDSTDPSIVGPRYGLTLGPGPTGPSPNNTAFFLNVPPGRVTVIATVVALGKVSSRLTVSVRAGYFTQVMLHPTP